MLALSRVPATYPAPKRQRDPHRRRPGRAREAHLPPGTDMSLKLIALANYVREPAWKDARGDEWSLGRVVKEELARPAGTTPTAATSRLLGLSYTLETLARRGEPIEGDFLRAKRYVNESVQYALRTQNADGSWGRNTTRNYPSALSFTGHVFEWLAFALPEDRLQDRQIVQSVQYCAACWVRSIINRTYNRSAAGRSRP